MIPQTPEFAVPILKAVVLFSSAVLLFLSEPAINRMSHCSKFTTRMSFHFLPLEGLEMCSGCCLATPRTGRKRSSSPAQHCCCCSTG